MALQISNPSNLYCSLGVGGWLAGSLPRVIQPGVDVEEERVVDSIARVVRFLTCVVYLFLQVSASIHAIGGFNCEAAVPMVEAADRGRPTDGKKIARTRLE